MLKYQSQSQLSFFKTPFEQHLNENNRWVQLADNLAWDELVKMYNNKLCKGFGAPGIDARKVIGALIIKHKLCLSDRETIEMIKENVYMQYFVGLPSFSHEEIFHHTEFVYIRRRLSEVDFNSMTETLMRKAGLFEADTTKVENEKKQGDDLDKDGTGSDQPGNQPENVNVPLQDTSDQKDSDNASEVCGEQHVQSDSETIDNKGELKLDATVADQKIKYPNDVELLNTGRQEVDRMIDRLCEDLEVKRPRTYRRKGRAAFLDFAKKKNKTFKQIHKARTKQLNFLKRNLKRLDMLIGQYEAQDKGLPLAYRDLRILWAVRLMYAQQLEMHRHKTHRIEHRIVSIYQPYVRPMVRGKAKNKVEFGSKNGISLQNGYAFIETLSWDAYNENIDLQKGAENYKNRFGYYPAQIIADAIYHTLDNKNFCKENHIQLLGKTLSKTAKSKLSAKERKEHKRLHNSRNHIEGKFGQGKSGYDLNKIAARYANTSASWIAAIYFVMNILRFAGSSFLPFLQLFSRNIRQWIYAFTKIFKIPALCFEEISNFIYPKNYRYINYYNMCWAK